MPSGRRCDGRHIFLVSLKADFGLAVIGAYHAIPNRGAGVPTLNQPPVHIDTWCNLFLILSYSQFYIRTYKMSNQDIPSLLQARYGSTPPSWPSDSPLALNPTLETLLAHRSVRGFLPAAPLPAGTLELLVAAAQSAATSSNLQTWSVVALTDPAAKADASVLSGDQAFIRDAPLFLVFCADLQRLTAVGRLRGTAGAGLAYTEMFLMAAVDAALAAQNACVAAEALGLGACYVGGVRNQPRAMAALLGLPSERVLAVFGLAVGVPDPAKLAASRVKPRLALGEVLHRERWGGGHHHHHHDEEGTATRAGGEQQEQQGAAAKYQEEQIRAYDDVLASFNAGQQREGIPAWTERSAKRVQGVENLTGRHVWSEVLREKGFEMK